MPTKAFKFYRIPAQAPYQRHSFYLGLHPSILGGSVRLGTALLRDRNWERRPVPKISHDWYQTETQVVIEVRIKKLKADECKIEIGDTNLSVTAPLPTGSEYSLELDLAHPVVPAQSGYKVKLASYLYSQPSVIIWSYNGFTSFFN